MAIPRMPVARLWIEDGGYGRRELAVGFGRDRDPELRLPIRMGPSQLREQREYLRGALDDLTNMVRRRGAGLLGRAAEGLERLNRRGLTVLFQLFGDACAEISQKLSVRCRFWREFHGSRPVIAIEGSLGELVPLEILPLFDVSEWPVVEDCESLFRAVRRFPAFSAVIMRNVSEARVCQDRILHNVPALAVRCICDNTLRAAEKEVAFFQDRPEWFVVEGPWPGDPSSEQIVIQALAKHLWDPGLRFGGGGGFPDQVLHFVCHCMARGCLTSECHMSLTGGRKATIGQLQGEFATLSVRPRPEIARPLVFMNACGSSTIDPEGVTSFPRFFLVDNGNRGFIGTETRVPDEFAAAFSREFYTALMKGWPVGDAVHWARWRLLRLDLNPLGILYTVYADPDMRVRKPVTDGSQSG